WRQVLRPFDPGCPQVGQGGAAGATYGGIAAGQRHGLEVPDAGKLRVARHEDLSAPDGAVRPEPRPVKGDTDDVDVRWHAVLGHDRRDVGVVVLDFGHRAPRCLLRPALRLIAGVDIG